MNTESSAEVTKEYILPKGLNIPEMLFELGISNVGSLSFKAVEDLEKTRLKARIVGGPTLLTEYPEICVERQNRTDIVILCSGDSIEFNADSSDIFNAQWSSAMITHIDISGVGSKYLTNTKSMFSSCRKLKSITFGNLDTSKVTNMDGMFAYCETLKHVEFNRLDTSNVTSMNGIFSHCTRLEEIDMSGLNLEHVISMHDAFEDCKRLKAIDMTGLNLGHMRSMFGAFEGCKSIEYMSFDHSNVSRVEDISYMFYRCRNLKSVDLSSFKYINYIVHDMFEDCNSLKNVITDSTAIRAEFSGDRSGLGEEGETAYISSCADYFTFWIPEKISIPDILRKHNITEVNTLTFRPSLHTKEIFNDGKDSRCCFDTGIPGMYIVKDSSDIEVMCSGTDIKLGENSSTLFKCSGNLDEDKPVHIKNIDLSMVRCYKVINVQEMFSGNETLEKVNFGDLEEAPIRNADRMFAGCKSLESVNFAGFHNTRNGWMRGIFDGCENLKSVNFGKMNMLMTEDISMMFRGCSSIEHIDLGRADFERVKDASSMFENCSKLKSVNLGNFRSNRLKNASSMFAGCSELERIDVKLVSSVANPNTSHMFDGCNKLSSIPKLFNKLSC